MVWLAGRLERDQAPELVRLCDEAPGPVRLDLVDLVSADATGVETLCRLRSRGAELVGASPYIAMQLETSQRALDQSSLSLPSRPGHTRRQAERTTREERED